VLVTVAAGAAWSIWGSGQDAPSAQPRQAPKSVQPTPAQPSATLPAATGCAAPLRRPFVPRTIRVAGSTWSVIAPPRDSAGVPGTPPLTSFGKQVFAWDPEQRIRPGDRRGNVLLNAHTWPDGTALGNQLLRSLEPGNRIVLRGKKGTQLCYRVTKRLEVAAARGYPPYYATAGPPQLAIIVCSPPRLGPGNWVNRTIWFAAPTSTA